MTEEGMEEEHASETTPLLDDIVYKKALAEFSQGRPGEALKILESGGGSPSPQKLSGPLVTEGLLLKGRILLQLERFSEAMSSFEEVAKRDPNCIEGSLGKAKTLLELGRHREALDLLRQTISISPSPEAYLSISEAEAGLGSLDGAVEAVLKGLELSGTSIPLLLRLGDLKFRQERWEEAAEAYAQAISVDAMNADLYLKLGKVEEKRSRSKEAVRAYREAVRLAPGNARAHLSLALALIDSGAPEEALPSIEASLKIDPNLDAAQEARNLALQKAREARIESYSRKALFLSAKLNRPLTRPDLFVTLNVPSDVIDAVMEEISRSVEINLSSLSAMELSSFEEASHRLISRAFQKGLSGARGAGLTLGDVLALSPPEYSLTDVQRLHAYLREVLSLNPESLKPTRTKDDIVRKALLFSPEERTPFHLVKNFGIGLYEAMIIDHVVCTMAPDSRTSPSPTPFRPASTVAEEPRSFPVGRSLSEAPKGARCAGCGGHASYLHECGANVCRHCIAQFSSCPRCSVSLALTGERAAVFAPAIAKGTPRSKAYTAKSGMTKALSPVGRVQQLIQKVSSPPSSHPPSVKKLHEERSQGVETISPRSPPPEKRSKDKGDHL